MNGVALGLIIATAIVLLVGIILWVFLTILLKRMQAAGKQRLDERFTKNQIVRVELTANFLGVESRGFSQLRGNGVLVLTQNELWFSRFVMREDLAIPLETIREVRLVDSHLGKWIIGRKLVYVQFLSPTGLDAVAWLVGNPNIWKMAIESLIGVAE